MEKTLKMFMAGRMLKAQTYPYENCCCPKYRRAMTYDSGVIDIRRMQMYLYGVRWLPEGAQN